MDNGFDGLLKIGRQIPSAVILALSGHVKNEKEVLQSGADGFFKKGRNPKELLDTLARHVPAMEMTTGVS